MSHCGKGRFIEIAGGRDRPVTCILPKSQHTENIIYQMYIPGFSRLQRLEGHPFRFLVKVEFYVRLRIQLLKQNTKKRQGHFRPCLLISLEPSLASVRSRTKLLLRLMCASYLCGTHPGRSFFSCRGCVAPTLMYRQYFMTF